jgi:ADP-heptose:LPS heptosyltransferase
MDGIGDYLLFRNFIKILKENESYHNITLIGNDEWRDLAEFLDSEQVSSFIWVNKKRLKSSWKYRQKLRIQLQRCHYKTVLNLAYNRDFFYDDQIVQWCSSEHKVGVRGELREHWLKIKGDAIYHHLIEEKEEVCFEYHRNVSIVSQALEQAIRAPRYALGRDFPLTSHRVQKPKAILFVGGSDRRRRWGLDNYQVLAEELVHHGYRVFFCGKGPFAPSDFSVQHDHVEYFLNQTDLVSFGSQLQGADLLISNDTMAVHLAMAMKNINVVVISNGNHMGRFSPYPWDKERYRVVYPPCLQQELKDGALIKDLYKREGNTRNINDISPSEVLKMCQQVKAV